jgi:hypothetical protein
MSFISSCRTVGPTLRVMIDIPKNDFVEQHLRSADQRRTAKSRATPRVLIRAEPGHYVLRIVRNGPLTPALIYQHCPMVVPQPGAAGGPHPDDWCRPLDRSPVLRAQINGRPEPIDRVWTSRSLRPVSAGEYAFRIGPLRLWARSQRHMPETRPHRPVDLTTLPSLY